MDFSWHFSNENKLYPFVELSYDVDYESLHKNIMRIDSKIRFATIFDVNGIVLYSAHRDGVTNMLSPEENQKSLDQAVIAWKNRNEFANKIGKGMYVLAVYEKIKRITMPLDDEHLLYITTEVNANHDKIIEKALKLKQDALHAPDGMP